MKKSFLISILLVTVVLLANFNKSESKNNFSDTNRSIDSSLKVIYFAGGCFWGTEHFFKQIRGVTKTSVGYANGNFKNPSYEQVIKGNTGFVETVKVTYDPEIIELGLLIDLYLKTIDPTSLNRQGNDVGTQYKTGIYFIDKLDQKLILQKLEELAKKYSSTIVVEAEPLKNYYDAETYHQKYLEKNPGGYCHIGSDLFDVARKANRTK